MVICGLDESGRGPLAGPIVASAVILPRPITGLNDSKKLKPHQREYLFEKIYQSGTVAVETISVELINTHGIGWANKELFLRLMKELVADKHIVDGNLKITGADSVVRADEKIPEVMAASIIAKVTRDRLMETLDKQFPAYYWRTNKGYGTKQHILSLHQHGISLHHRRAFVDTALQKNKI